ncbi:CDP-alcohol phosphatidyltransferase family protein [Candidatus Latescibacterota bacterium]
MISQLKGLVNDVLRPVARLLIRIGFRPDWLTMLGFLTSIVGMGAYATGHLRWGAALIILGGGCDILDGQVAREGQSESKFGALLDSTTDRYAEIFLYFGIGAYLIRQQEWSGKWAAVTILFFALAGSLMVSYVRARAEGLGQECKVGFMQRAERLVALAAGSLFGHDGLIFVLVILAVTTNYTVLERLAYIRRNLNAVPQTPEAQGSSSSSVPPSSAAEASAQTEGT